MKRRCNLLALFFGPVILIYFFLHRVRDKKPEMVCSENIAGTIQLFDSKSTVLEMENGPDKSSATFYVTQMMQSAVCQHASDIFIDPQDRQYLVRMRIDGVIRQIDTLPMDKATGVIGVIKV